MTELAEYRRKRRFDRTPEPTGERRTTAAKAADGGSDGARRFVVQRHRARRLHYDLRFEIDGVLVSWAVPKGPTLDPGVKRMAVHVEDHPMEYADFEGVIPKGQYGGGDVIVWDHGTWEPVKTDDPARAVQDGELHAEMHGEKLHGRLVLVRRDDKGPDKADEWLLLHKRDDHAVEGWDPEDHPRSVMSGRTNEEVKAAPERRWRSDKPARSASEPVGAGEYDDSAAEPPSDDELAALADLGKEGTWEVFGRRLKVTNLDKELFPGRDGEPPITKRELLAYSAAIAPTALPYLQGRALNMHRYPNGAGSKGFWHKELPDHAPGWMPRWGNPLADPGPGSPRGGKRSASARGGQTQTHLVVDEPAALVWAANFGALEWHPWTSRTEQPECPSYVMFDIDPGERTTWDEVLRLARLHRTAFERLGVRAQPKVTGKRGLQIWVPIAHGPTFDDTRAWAERVSRTVGKIEPDLVSWKWQKKDRAGRARLDYTQNAINKTLVAPYSPRPAAGAPVSTPIGWHELDDPDLRPDRWTIRTVLDRLDEHGDPFRGMLVHDQELPEFS